MTFHIWNKDQKRVRGPWSWWAGSLRLFLGAGAVAVFWNQLSAYPYAMLFPVAWFLLEIAFMAYRVRMNGVVWRAARLGIRLNVFSRLACLALVFWLVLHLTRVHLQNLTCIPALPPPPEVQFYRMLRVSAENARTRLDVQSDDERSPGWSFHSFLRIHQLPSNRNGFIFDLGPVRESNRISLYVDADRNLCFRVFDKDSQSLAVKALPGLGSFDFDVWCYVVCEIGGVNSSHFVRIFVNGRKVAERKLTAPISFDESVPDREIVLGANLEKTHAGFFDLKEQSIFDKTQDERMGELMLTYMGNYKYTRKYVAFNGRAWLSRRFHDPSRGPLSNSDTNTSPLFMIE